jgi:hypothetical protein
MPPFNILTWNVKFVKGVIEDFTQKLRKFNILVKIFNSGGVRRKKRGHPGQGSAPNGLAA